MNSNLTSQKLERDLNKIRNKKVEKIRHKIASGSYHIDNVKLAKALFLSK